LPCHYAAENGEQDKIQSCSPLSSAPLYGKNGYTTFVVVVGLCGGSAPTPPTSPKEQNLKM